MWGVYEDGELSNPEEVQRIITPKEQARGAEKHLGEGSVKWFHDGLKIPQEVLAASEAYLTEEDTMGQFIEDRLERVPEHSGYFTTMHDLTFQFEHWCENNGHQPWSKRNFKKALKERGFEEGRQANARGFKDLRFK